MYLSWVGSFFCFTLPLVQLRNSCTYYPLRPQGDYLYGLGQIYRDFQPKVTGLEIIELVRTDGQPDVDGNPPATTEPIFSADGTILQNPDNLEFTIGETSYPPPALISQPGDFLYDGARAPLQRILDGTRAPWMQQRSPQALESKPGDPLYDAARVPLQWVLDGTPPPWARNENPVAMLPGSRSVPSAPAAPASIPQPDVSPSPEPDDKPINPYPFFDPITFPDTTTPSQFDLKPAFTPHPVTPNPLEPNPLTPTTDSPDSTPSKFPKEVPSTGTPFAPNPTTRNPEPATTPQTTTKPATEPTPEKSPTDRILEQLPGIATGIALITPLVRNIQTQTAPENLIPNVKEGVCQSLNGGCTTGNVNQQLASNGTKLDAINTGLQAIDLTLLSTIDNKLGAQISNGGIGGLLGRVGTAIGQSRVIE